MKAEFEKELKHNEVTEELRTNHFTSTGEYSTDEVILEWYNKDKSNKTASEAWDDNQEAISISEKGLL